MKTSLSTLTRVALRTLGSMIKCARLERGMSQKELAERLNKSRYTVIALEKGNPDVSIGAVFEAAAIVGVRLLADDRQSLQKLSNVVANFTTVLPQRSKHKQEKLDDDF